MRQEIKNALAQSQKTSDFLEDLRKTLPDGMNLSDYPDIKLPPEAEAGLEAIYKNQALLIACARLNTMVTIAGVHHATSIDIHWSSNLREEIVIELSQWGPLAAVFVYGMPPAGLLAAVDTCIDSLGLIKLSESEVDEIYEQGLYTTLF